MMAKVFGYGDRKKKLSILDGYPGNMLEDDESEFLIVKISNIFKTRLTSVDGTSKM